MEELVLMALVALAVGVFAFAGMDLFGREWKSYAERAAASRRLRGTEAIVPSAQLWYLALLAAAACGLLGFFALGSGFLALLAAIGGGFIPRGLAARRLAKRKDRFRHQFADALDLIANVLRAGRGFQQALELLHAEFEDPLREEVGIVLQELRLGMPIPDSLKNLSLRVQEPEVEIFRTAVGVSLHMGGNLAEVLQNISRTVRSRLQAGGRVRALTATGRMQGAILAGLPVFMIVVINLIEPDYLQPLLVTGPGWMLLGLAVVLDLLGYFFIRRMCSVEI